MLIYYFTESIYFLVCSIKLKVSQRVNRNCECDLKIDIDWSSDGVHSHFTVCYLRVKTYWHFYFAFFLQKCDSLKCNNDDHKNLTPNQI